MPRRAREATGGMAYHVLNRGAAGMALFSDQADFLAMERIIERTCEAIPIRVVCYCLMGSHFHLVLWPEKDGQLSEFMRLLSTTHATRFHAHHHSAGAGPVYQGRFKSFPIQRDEHFATVCRYVERNPLRARLVKRAEHWQWSSLAKRLGEKPPEWLMRQKDWPVDVPPDWVAWVNRAETADELAALRNCIKRGCPYGSDRWVSRTAARLGLESALRPRGRPRIHPIKDK